MSILFKSIRLALMGLCCCVFLGSMALGISSAPAEGDGSAAADEKPDPNKALKEAKEKAELEKDIAKAQKDLIEARVGALPKGTTDTPADLSLEAKILACKAIAEIAKHFALDLKEAEITGKLVEVDPSKYPENAISVYASKSYDLKVLRDAMQALDDSLETRNASTKSWTSTDVVPALAALGQVLSLLVQPCTSIFRV